ncbi:MAG: phosphoglycerate kinase, partial [Candidatus Dadabacteria bacterium]|nr:phosphoglycerate kinase [Candidatus Dadabacteria bacterium]NIS08602.1 phosphoglycerate kinase [Candidatus Dadabacteria bacterium]NIY21994.1 phosphoglycerate kinase [Candidatus Dadabacteria bacterium]
MSDKLLVSDLKDSEIKGKVVFVRVDFNVPIRDGKISENYRIRRTVPTIDYLVDRGAKVVVASHMGRPRGNVISSLSLKPVAERLAELLGREVKFVGKTVGKEVDKSVKALKNGEILVLENLRFHIEERDNDPKFCKHLASLANIYVNDAFGTSHRAHASTFGMAEHFKKRLAGFVVDRELKFLHQLIDSPKRPYLVIVGGSKIKDKIHALKNLIEKADEVIIGGGVAYTFLKAKGVNVGNSVTEEEMIPWVKEALDKHGDKIVLPVDHIVAESFENRKNLIVVDNEIPDELHGFDIGPKTASKFISHIRRKHTIFWSGPMGVFEVDDFSSGTTHIARAIALATWRGSTTVVGGGDTTSAL